MFEQWRQLRLWLEHGSQLFWLRLKLLRLDAVAQIRSLALLFAAILAAAVVFFLGFISLLFGLNSILEPQYKAWVFFGLGVFLIVSVLLLLGWVVRLLQKQGGFMQDTLDAMAEDMAYLNGRYLHNDVEAEHGRQH